MTVASIVTLSITNTSSSDDGTYVCNACKIHDCDSCCMFIKIKNTSVEDESERIIENVDIL